MYSNKSNSGSNNNIEYDILPSMSIIFPFLKGKSELRDVIIKIIIGVSVRLITALIIYLIWSKYNLTIYNDSIIDMTLIDFDEYCKNLDYNPPFLNKNINK